MGVSLRASENSPIVVAAFKRRNAQYLSSYRRYRGRVSLDHVARMKAALGISGVSAEVNAWQCAPALDEGVFESHIDLLIVRRDQVINLCEMKYAESGYFIDAAFDRSQRRKISDFRKEASTKHTIHSTLVTTYGVEPNAYAGDIQAVITADDLFK